MVRTLDLIIIGYNEANNLPRCLKAARLALQRMEERFDINGNLVFVNDYWTTDDSSAVAQRFGAKVLRSSPLYRAPGNPRMSGVLMTEGEMIMFQDADCELDPDWLHVGLKHLESNRHVDGVIGQVNVDRTLISKSVHIENYGKVDTYQAEMIQHTGSGSILLKREALVKAGGIEPHLLPFQDVYLMVKLQKCGARIELIPHKMEDHFQVHFRTFSGAIKKARQVLFRFPTEIGHLLRHTIQERTFSYMSKFYTPYFIHMLVLSLFLIGGYAYISTSHLIWLVISFGMLVGYGIYLWVERHNPLLAFIRFITLTFSVPGIILGFIFKIPNIDWGVQNKLKYLESVKAANPGVVTPPS